MIASEGTGPGTKPIPLGEKARCHCDYVDPDTAKRLQTEKGGVVVQLDVRPALGIAKDEGRLV